MQSTYLSAAETAKLVRAALKRHFPDIKFGVRSRTYSGGASIDVSWTDGPTDAMVTAITGQYSGSNFDGMIDLKTSHSSWLLPDGSAIVASDPGSVGSGGVHHAERNWMPHPEAKLVSFCADFVFTHRRMSPEFAERVLASVQRRYGKLDLAVKVSGYDGSAHIAGDFEAERIAHRVASRFISVRAA